MENIKEQIKILREKQGLTYGQFAEKIGLEESVVRNWEKGTQLPNLGQIQSICREFDTNDKWLLCGTGQMEGYSIKGMETLYNEIDKVIDSMEMEDPLRKDMAAYLDRHGMDIKEETEETNKIIDGMLHRIEEDRKSTRLNSSHTS